VPLIKDVLRWSAKVFFYAVNEVVSISEEPASLATLEESLGEAYFCTDSSVMDPELCIPDPIFQGSCLFKVF
jgi:hypothetical protein